MQINQNKYEQRQKHEASSRVHPLLRCIRNQAHGTQNGLARDSAAGWWNENGIVLHKTWVIHIHFCLLVSCECRFRLNGIFDTFLWILDDGNSKSKFSQGNGAIGSAEKSLFKPNNPVWETRSASDKTHLDSNFFSEMMSGWRKKPSPGWRMSCTMHIFVCQNHMMALYSSVVGVFVSWTLRGRRIEMVNICYHVSRHKGDED